MRLTMKTVHDGAIVTATVAARTDGLERTCSQFFEDAATVADVRQRMAEQVAREIASTDAARGSARTVCGGAAS